MHIPAGERHLVLAKAIVREKEIHGKEEKNKQAQHFQLLHRNNR